jgi:HAD superfamily hydrolase (TIGR01549 family)
MIHAIVFDAFGTLLTYGGQRRNPYVRILAAIDRTDSRLPFLTQNVSIDVFAAELGLVHLLPEIHQSLTEDLAGIRAFDDVADTIETLRAAGLRIAICSNLAQPYGTIVRQLLPALDGYVFSYEIGAKKPDPAIYRAACAAVSCAPGEILFIGDSRRADLEGPKAYGMQARLIDRRADQLLAEVLPLATLDAIQQFLSKLEGYDIEAVILYGSRARGDHDSESDADLAIILRGGGGSLTDAGMAMADIAFDVLLDTAILISPLPIWQTCWNQPVMFSNPALLHNIKRDGICIEIPS